MKRSHIGFRLSATVAVASALLLGACGSATDSGTDTTVAAPVETTAAASPETVAAPVETTAASPVETTAAAPAETVAAAPTETTAAAAAGAGATADGEWKITQGSEAGYRVPETLQGQKTEGVGRTTAITGSMTIAGTQATAGEFVFDLTKLQSDSGKRDEKVQGSILNTAEFPNATFKLTGPVDFGKVPADKETVKAKAAGELTLHGVTKPVEVELQARMNGGNVEVLGSLPITFADWNIDNPSIKPFVEVGDTGTIEWLLVMAKA
jgi:polyisoprenoid-binding protein YceI